MNQDFTIIQAFIFILFLTPFITIYIVHKVTSGQKIKVTKSLLDSIDKSDFEFFDNLTIQTSSYSNFKIISGFNDKGFLYINNNRMYLLSSRQPSLLIYSALPMDLKNMRKDNQFEIKICTWKAVSLIFKDLSPKIFNQRKEILIEPKNLEDFERLKNILKNWC
jgi:hypothetical protein